MPNQYNKTNVHKTHVAEVPHNRPRLGHRLTARQPQRNIIPTRLAIGTVSGKPGFALVLIDAKRDAAEFELHPTVMLAIGQAEIEFGVSPSDWHRATTATP